LKADVSFENTEQPTTVIEKLNKIQYKDQVLSVHYSRPYTKPYLRDYLSGRAKAIRVSGLEHGTKSEDIAAAIQEYCTREDGSKISPIEIHTVKSKTGFSIGLAKVVFDTTEEATIAQQKLEGKEINGKAVDVNYWAMSKQFFRQHKQKGPKTNEA